MTTFKTLLLLSANRTTCISRPSNSSSRKYNNSCKHTTPTITIIILYLILIIILYLIIIIILYLILIIMLYLILIIMLHLTCSHLSPTPTITPIWILIAKYSTQWFNNQTQTTILMTMIITTIVNTILITTVLLNITTIIIVLINLIMKVITIPIIILEINKVK